MYVRSRCLFSFSPLTALRWPSLCISGASAFPFISAVGSRRWIRSQNPNDVPDVGTNLKQIKLLVDGDRFGSRHVIDAMDYLTKTLVKSKNMSELLQRSDVSFVPVPRGQDEAAEPNDDAINREMQMCGSDHLSGHGIVLLTADKGFADMIRQVMSSKRSIFALIPSTEVAVLDFYKAQGIPVLLLPSEQGCIKVRSILETDGNGTVKLGEAFEPSAHRALGAAMYGSWEDHLAGQGCSALFSSSGAYPIQRVAKFWFANSLGPLPVFPVALGVFALDVAIRQQSREWISNTKPFAFVSPVTSPGTITGSGLNIYGSKLARRIFRGGGPFMLQDSPELSDQALHKLGYLDDLWNADFTEALSSFCNASTNKGKMRKLGLSVDPTDTTSDVAAKLRAALLSDDSNANWEIGGRSTAAVIQILRSNKLLDTCAFPKDPAMDELWFAMKCYARVHKLPQVKNFNTLAAHLLQHQNQNDPLRRGRVVIKA